MQQRTDGEIRPLIAVTTDLIERKGRATAMVTTAYGEAIERAGGLPVALAATAWAAERVGEIARRFDGFVFTGGDDPRTEPFGEPTHLEARPVRPERQAFETALLRELAASRPGAPALGVCLGMQMMALVAGGRLDQHLPDTMPNAGRHWDGEHEVVPEGTASGVVPRGVVWSRHRQAVIDPGGLSVLARSDDGLIEAVGDPGRAFWVGVQWHPERTAGAGLGQGLFAALVASCG